MTNVATAGWRTPEPARRRRPAGPGRAVGICGAVLLLLGGLGGAVGAAPAAAPDEPVSIHLTTSDAGGRTVLRGLEAQTPVAFVDRSADAAHTITVNENVRYQRFVGGGASITDSAAYLLRGGPVSAATRDEVMRRLFDPVAGIGLSFVRNPIGASDLSRPGMVSLDDTCCDLADFGTNGYDTDVRLLTGQAKALNPALTVMGAPWSAPGWMKDNGRMDQMGWLKREYYPTYAEYLVKYLQSYAAAGVAVDYLSVQNEPNCCHAQNPTAMNYPGMNWDPATLVDFTSNHVYPALRAAGLRTKVLVHDWNYGDYSSFGARVLGDDRVRNDPLFGGIAWHGYWGDPAVGTQVRAEHPSVPQFSTEHSGGTWVANQHDEDLRDIVQYARNWSGSLVKWSLALNQHNGPHNGGCGTCSALVTVQEGGPRAGRVDNTIEYYTTGHLTKFVRPGAHRIESSDGAGVDNVAWRNPDGTKALIAHNSGGAARAVKIRWGSRSLTYTMPARTSATFTWGGEQDGTGPTPDPVPSPGPAGVIRSDLNAKCLDVANGSDRSTVQMWSCHAGPNQTWQYAADGTVRSLGRCLDVRDAGTGDGAPVQLSGCHGGPGQQWRITAARTVVNRPSGRCLDIKDVNPADGARLQLWTCAGTANQRWTVPS